MKIENDEVCIDVTDKMTVLEWYEVWGRIEEGLPVIFTKDGEELPHGLLSLVKGYKPEVLND